MNIIREHISHPNRSYRLLRIELGAFAAGRHRHRQIELTWIERGSGLRFVGDSVEPYEPGDMALIGPHLPHAWISGRHARGTASQAATVLQIPPELLALDALPELAAARQLVDAAGRGLRIDEPLRSAVAEQLRQLPGRSGLRGVAGLLELIDLLVERRDALVPLASTAAARASNPEQDRRVARVVNWVQRHLAEELAVDAAARLVHVSPAAFSRYFRREVGKGFARYVNDVRCGEACLRLHGNDRAIATIATECGFGTMSNFNRQFKLRTGLTPREFRRGRLIRAV